MRSEACVKAETHENDDRSTIGTRVNRRDTTGVTRVKAETHEKDDRRDERQ